MSRGDGGTCDKDLAAVDALGNYDGEIRLVFGKNYGWGLGRLDEALKSIIANILQSFPAIDERKRDLSRLSYKLNRSGSHASFHLLRSGFQLQGQNQDDEVAMSILATNPISPADTHRLETLLDWFFDRRLRGTDGGTRGGFLSSTQVA